MKNCNINFHRLKSGILVLLVYSLNSCGQRSIPREMVGHWTTQKHLITVRTKPEGKWKFTSDTASITFNINNDHTVDGFIGSAKFENGEIRLNWLLPVRMSGQAFTIKCGKIEKIFENDPLDLKDVELWLGPIINGTIDGELRYTQGHAYFPMAGAIFTKAED